MILLLLPHTRLHTHTVLTTLRNSLSLVVLSCLVEVRRVRHIFIFSSFDGFESLTLVDFLFLLVEKKGL